jgi:hypothetical protein
MTQTFLTHKGGGLSAAVAEVVSTDDLRTARARLKVGMARRERQTGRMLTRLCACGNWKGLHSRSCKECFQKGMRTAVAKGAVAGRRAEPFVPPVIRSESSRQGMVGVQRPQPKRPMMRLVDGKWEEA